MSDIEQQFAISIVWFIALLFTFGAGAAGLAILGDHYGRRLLGWWRRRRNAKGERTQDAANCRTIRPRTNETREKGSDHAHARAREPQVRIVLMRPEIPEDQFDLLEIDDVHRSGWRCPQGMRVIHGGKR